MDTPVQTPSFPDPLSYEPYYNAQTAVKVPSTPPASSGTEPTDNTPAATPELTYQKPQTPKPQHSQPIQPTTHESSDLPSSQIPPEAHTTPEATTVPQPATLPIISPVVQHNEEKPLQAIPPQLAKSSPLKVVGIVVILLLILGGIGFIAMTFLNQSSQQAATPVVPTKTIVQTDVPTTAPVASSSAVPLTLLTPQNADVTSTSQVTVSGKTSPLTTVIVFTDANQQEVQSTQTGDFTVNVTLEKGLNKVSTVVMTKQGSTLLERYIINE